MHHHHHHEIDHHHQPHHTAFGLAIGLNLLFVLIESYFALHAQSMSLLADAGHNLGDVMGLGLAWLASWLLTRKSSERYSYGYKKTTILAALINALLLVATTAIIAFESLQKLVNPSSIEAHTMMWVAAIGILINGSTALLFWRDQHDDLNLKGAFLHLCIDAMISLGVVVTGGLIWLTGWLIFDPIMGLVIVTTILYNTWELLRDSVNLLLDGIPHSINRAEVIEYLLSIDGVTAVHDLHIWGLSTKETALTAHLVMPTKMLSDTDYEVINHHLLHVHRIAHITLQVEQGAHHDPCGQRETC